MDQYKENNDKIKIMFNVNIIGQGIDIPDIDCVVFMDP